MENPSVDQGTLTSKRSLRARWHNFWHRNEKRLSTLAFLGGVFWDNVMLQRIDMLIDNLFFSFYVLVTASSIVLYHSLDYRALRKKVNPPAIIDWLPFVIQFCFGALFSGFFVFYSRSGSLFTSWPFLLFLLILLFGNEHVRKHYARLTFQVMMFFVVIFSYCIFLVPLLLHRMGPAEFVLSGIFSLIIMLGLLYILYKATPERYLKSRPLMLFSIASIFIIFNVLYFTNIIPPIPLSLKEIGIYHYIERTSDGNYRAVREKLTLFDIRDRLNPTFHYSEGEAIYAYTSIFSPTSLDVTVSHEWYKYDEESKKWIFANRVPYPITGGGANGFRGYSVKENISPGLWRVDVVTEREQLLGRLKFTVVKSISSVEMETLKK